MGNHFSADGDTETIGLCLQKRDYVYPVFWLGNFHVAHDSYRQKKGKDAFAQVVSTGKKRLADGQWIIMFPEGTRIPVGKKGSYKGGGARLAVETNTPVVPIALNSG
jgi:1-acyl-sn-glycerol-3-phosphate acyltransferase